MSYLSLVRNFLSTLYQYELAYMFSTFLCAKNVEIVFLDFGRTIDVRILSPIGKFVIISMKKYTDLFHNITGNSIYC